MNPGNLHSLSARTDPTLSRSKRQRRAHPRVEFIQHLSVIRIHHPGGSITRSRVTTQDLSADGVRFLYGNYLHIGTVVIITLRRRRGGEEDVVGTVIRCQYVPGSLHDIGVKFKQTIFPQLYVDPLQWELLYDTPTVDAASLAGDVLLLDQAMDRDLFQHLLKGTAINLTSVNTAEEALVAVKKQKFQVACIDVNLGGARIPGPQAAKILRAAGFAGQIIFTGVDPARRAEAARVMGTTLSLQKPYDRAQLHYMLATALHVPSDEKLEPIYSQLEDRASCKELLERYVNHAHEAATEIQRLIEANDFDAVRQQCQALRGTASGYGFQILADAAAKAGSALDAGCLISEAEAELLVLKTICRRLAVE
jgi:CheY-like chemotaxis protein/HPt (histidine-containing phosphotransfer) domain-containing protein